MKKMIGKAFCLVSTLVFVNSVMASESTTDKKFNETVSICLNLDIYGTLSLKARESGMPLEESTKQVSNSMKENLSTMPEGMLNAYIDVVKELYKIVDSDKSINRNNIDSAIFSACSKYHGYNVDKAKLKSELSNYVQSAFDPNKRVHYCQKAGETAANISVARDKGMSKDEIKKIAEGALANDKITKESLPRIVEEVYKYPSIDTPSFYFYNIKSCGAKIEGVKISSLEKSSEKIISCQSIQDKNEKTGCLSKAISVN